jgi:hypothetical protein
MNEPRKKYNLRAPEQNAALGVMRERIKVEVAGVIGS